jgi:hypothetical protein
MTKFKVGDKVKQVQPEFPYGRLSSGETFKGAVGTVIAADEQAHYPYEVRFPFDEGTGSTWLYKSEEVQAAEPEPEPQEVHIVYGHDYDDFILDEVYTTYEAAEERVRDIKAEGTEIPTSYRGYYWSIETKEVQ